MRTRLALAGSALSLMMLAACSSGASSSSSTPAAAGGGSSSSSVASAPTSGGTVVALAQTNKGQALTGPNGHSLYIFDPDTSTTSACTGGCATLWPPLTGPATAGSGATQSALGTLTRSDGTVQATYQGHPLYYYAPDTSAGSTSGDGVEGTWHLATLSATGGSAAGGSSAPAQTSSSASSGGGYSY